MKIVLKQYGSITSKLTHFGYIKVIELWNKFLKE